MFSKCGVPAPSMINFNVNMSLDLQAYPAEPKPSLSSRLIAAGLVRSVAWIAAVSVLASLAITGLAHLLTPPIVDLLTPSGIAVSIAVPLMVAPVLGYLLMRMLIESDIARKTVHELAIKDGLTEVYNRRYFMSQLDVEFAKSQRYKTPMAVIMLDADHFKRVNDTYGHGVGDVVLKRIAQTCTTLLRSQDVLARYGGEEFVVLLPQTDGASAVLLAERVRAGIAACVITVNEQPLQVTVSIGVAATPEHAATVAALLNLSDVALYAAKKNGRNQVASAEVAA